MLKFVEGFEVGTDLGMYQRKWESASAFTAFVTGRLHGSGIRTASTAMEWRTRSLTVQNTWVAGMGFRFRNSTIIDDTDIFPLIVKKGTGEQLRVQWRKVTGENTYELILFRGSTELARTSDAGSTGKFTSLNWSYFEFKFTIDPTSGSYEVRHNQQVIISGSGVNTAHQGSAGADVFELNYGSNSNFELDDFYFLDSTGTINNDFLGDSVIEGRVPTSDDSPPADWTIENGGFPSIDTYWEVLDGTTTGTPQIYIYSSTVSDQALVGFNSLSFITGQIHCVQVNSDARLDVTGTRQFKHIIRSGGTLYTTPTGGVNHSVASTSYATFYDIFELDPDTAAKWTISGVNNASFGVEVVS